MKLKPKQRKKLLAKARRHAGVCCVVLRNMTGDVPPAMGVMSAECSACGRTLRVNAKTAGSALVKMFLQCVSPSDDFCEHVIYWETGGKRTAHNLQGDQIDAPAHCHCRKPSIVVERDSTSVSPA